VTSGWRSARARKAPSLSIRRSNLVDSVPLTEVFEKSTVQVNLWRASSEKVVQRAVTEARANRFAPDVFETNGPEMEILYREKLLDEFYSPGFKRDSRGGVPQAPALCGGPLQLFRHRV
jgi:iron(III) transport system substrate-binding protein